MDWAESLADREGTFTARCLPELDGGKKTEPKTKLLPHLFKTIMLNMGVAKGKFQGKSGLCCGPEQSTKGLQRAAL